MSAIVYTVVAAIVALYTVLGACLYRRERRRPLQRDRIIREARDSYEGPDSLRLLEDLEADLKAYGKAVADFYEPVGPPPGPDPMWDAGRERLWDAVRDNQNQQGGPQ